MQLHTLLRLSVCIKAPDLLQLFCGIRILRGVFHRHRKHVSITDQPEDRPAVQTHKGADRRRREAVPQVRDNDPALTEEPLDTNGCSYQVRDTVSKEPCSSKREHSRGMVR